MNFISGFLFPYSLYGEDRLARVYRSSDKMFIAVNFHRIFRKGAKVGEGVRLSNTISLGQDCSVEQGSIIEKSILGKEVTVGKKSSIKHCIVLDGVKLG